MNRLASLLLIVASLASVAAAWWVNHRVDAARELVAVRPPTVVTAAAPSSAVSSVLSAPRSSSSGLSKSKAPPAIPVSKAPPANPVSKAPPAIPSHLFLPAIGVNTVISAAPSHYAYDRFLHRKVESFGVPRTMYTTSWWSADAAGHPQPRPGDPGMAVLLGHTQLGGYGVFNSLDDLHPGDRAFVTAGRSTLSCVTLKVKSGIPKADSAALARVLSSSPTGARLALITCSGSFDGEESVENTVVFLDLQSR